MVDSEFPSGPDPSSTHEFTPQEKSVVAGLSTAVFIVAGGWTVIATAVLVTGGLLLDTSTFLGGAVLVGGCLMAFPGFFLWRSAFSLKTFLRPQGGEMTHLVTAVGQMGGYFKAALLLSILAVVAGFILGIVGAAHQG
ncbi:hypothetical protein KKD52_08955 [Myxococcota bacterium]|nr:hypothetical protein [Myxococcota bacterium]MBU1412477.1 hypothetical protein [Myxococcota bacterium]MBU1510475.1 hypothetical protein [Myxococcota bacterium]